MDKEEKRRLRVAKRDARRAEALKRREFRKHLGFVVHSGRMSSLGSSGAVFAGAYTDEELAPYRSRSGIGRAHSDFS